MMCREWPRGWRGRGPAGAVLGCWPGLCQRHGVTGGDQSGAVRGWGSAPQTSALGQANPAAPPPPPSHTGPSRNEESLNILLETLLRLVLNPRLSEQQTPRAGPPCHPGRSAQLSRVGPLRGVSPGPRGAGTVGYIRRWEESAFDVRHPGLLYTCHPRTPAKESGEDCGVWMRREGERRQGPRGGLSLPLGRRHTDAGPQAL